MTVKNFLMIPLWILVLIPLVPGVFVPYDDRLWAGWPIHVAIMTILSVLQVLGIVIFAYACWSPQSENGMKQ